jgi:bifunctional non-homologous end joining protein LigD
MSHYFENLSEFEKKLIQRSTFPQWVNPMLATLTHERFSNPSWIFETKFDGERALTFYSDQEINIFSRNKHNLNKTYPDLVEAFHNGNMSDSFIVDGEIVAFDKDITSFSRLQQRLGVKEISLIEALKIPVYYYIFDILYLNGYDLRNLSLESRKKVLKKAFAFHDPLRLTTWVLEDGIGYFKVACEKGWEGIIAKNQEAPYQSQRSRDWLKFKCHKSQELIIIGYTAPKGHRQNFGALLVGYYKNSQLYYAGKVGTGFTTQTLTSLKEKMDRYVSPIPVVEDKIGGDGPIVWLQPRLVGEFDFTEWTRDGKLRHPRFKGLREDKSAKEVVREESQ